MDIVSFKEYYPSQESMNKKQRRSYDYISTCLDNGKYVDIKENISYLFTYMYEKLSLILNDTSRVKEIINIYKTLYNNYKNIDKISSYLLTWIGDLYCFQGEYKTALNYYNLDCSGTQTHLANKVLNIKYYKEIDIKTEEIFCITKLLTKFGIKNINKITEYGSIILKKEKEIKNKDYLQYIGDKYFNDIRKYKLTLFNGYPENYTINQIFHNKNKVFDIIPFYMINEFLEFAKELSRDAENLLREDRDIPKVGEGWVSETELYYKIKQYINELEVIHHYNSNWLGRQHLDIFVPKINLAFEYQGKQHFKPVNFFGGKEAFEKQKRRDKIKKRKCEKNNIKLVYVRSGYNFEEIKKKIKKEIKSLE